MKNVFCVTTLVLIILCVSRANAQTTTTTFTDGKSFTYSYITNPDHLPNFFVGLRANANPYAILYVPRRCMLRPFYASTTYNDVAKGGIDGFICLLNFSTHHRTRKIVLGESATGKFVNGAVELNQYAVKMDLETKRSLSIHFGYANKVLRSDVSIHQDSTVFQLSGIKGNEFSIGIGLIKRRGVWVSSGKISTYRDLISTFSVDFVLNTGYTYTVKNLYSSSTLNNSSSPFPYRGFRIAEELYWHPGWSRKVRSVQTSLSLRVALQSSPPGINTNERGIAWSPEKVYPEIMGGLHFSFKNFNLSNKAESIPFVETSIEKVYWRQQVLTYH